MRLQALRDIPSGSGVGAQGPDHLTFDLADASKLSLSFYGKRPGPGMRLDKLSMQFAVHETGSSAMFSKPMNA
jgi:glucose-6-phosphate 1-dehydrogenase